MSNAPQGVILAAGIASRWGGTEEKPYPKALEKLNGLSLLEYNIAFQKSIGVKSTIIVVHPNILDELLAELQRIRDTYEVELGYFTLDSAKVGESFFSSMGMLGRRLAKEPFTNIDGESRILDLNQKVIINLGDSPIMGYIENLTEPEHKTIKEVKGYLSNVGVHEFILPHYMRVSDDPPRGASSSRVYYPAEIIGFYTMSLNEMTSLEDQSVYECEIPYCVSINMNDREYLDRLKKSITKPENGINMNWVHSQRVGREGENGIILG